MQKVTKLTASQNAVKLAGFAHKYDVRGLSDMCQQYLIDAVQRLPKNIQSSDVSAVEWALLAQRYSLDHLLAECEFFLLKWSSDAQFWTNPLSPELRNFGDV